jgi:hypothetical protein
MDVVYPLFFAGEMLKGFADAAAFGEIADGIRRVGRLSCHSLSVAGGILLTLESAHAG